MNNRQITMNTKFWASLFLVFSFLFISQAHAQWSEPTQIPPAGNVLAPLRLDANGRLGIGLTAPGKIFEVATEIVSRASSASGGVAGSFAADSSGINLWVNSAYNPATPTSGWARLFTGTPAGNVGIGTLAPDSKLQVDVTANREIRFSTGQSATFTDASVFGPGITFSRGSDGANDIAAIFQYTTSGAANRLAISSRDDIVFASGGGSTYPAAIERMRIVASGNVGIGTSAPNEPLEVANAANGGRIIASDGQGASRRTLLLVSPTAASPLSRIESYNYATSLGLPLYINSSGAGNVSIGSVTPTYRLNVAGDVNVPTGSCYRVNGTCLSSGGMAGSGTVNTLSMFTAASTLGDSRLSQQADGSVRTTSPTGWVDIGPKNAGFNHIYTDRPATIFNTGVWAISGIFSAYNTDNLRLQTNGTDRITALASNGNVGIGTAAPAAKLDIFARANGSGYGLFVDTTTRTSGEEYVRFGDTTSADFMVNTTGNVGIGTNAPTQRLTVNGNINKAGGWIASGGVNWGVDALEIYNSSWNGSSNTNYGTVAAGHIYGYNGLQSGGATGGEAGDGQLYVQNTSMLMGNVGIGKNNPSNTLDVAGGMNVTGSVDASSLAFINNTHPTGGTGLSATAQINGLYGYAQNSGGWGVRGVGGGANGTGVRGEGYYGVRGQAQNGPAYATYGVYGATEGIYGTGAYGVYCLATSPGSLCGGNKSWTPASDIRLKKDISDLGDPLNKALRLNPVNFKWKNDPASNNIGFIAQEVKKVVPEIVPMGADGYYVLNYDSITAISIGAIKELNTKLEKLQSENDDLRERLERLEAKLK